MEGWEEGQRLLVCVCVFAIEVKIKIEQGKEADKEAKIAEKVEKRRRRKTV